MKGLKLNINICIWYAFAMGVTMAILNLYGSWSQHHLTEYDPFLYSTLIAIVLAFFGASVVHPDYKNVLTKYPKFMGKKEYRLEHALRITAYLFAGVIIFGVNSKVKFIEILHYVFTGLAIINGYITLLIWSKEKKQRTWSYIATGFGLVGFLLGFSWQVYSTSWAEVIAAFPLAVWLFKSLNYGNIST